MRRRAPVAVCLVVVCGMASAVAVRSPEPPLAPVGAPAAETCAADSCAEGPEICPMLAVAPRVAIAGYAAPAPMAIPAAVAPGDGHGPAAAGANGDGALAPRKRAWEASVGGAQAVKEHLRARLSGWPARRLADRSALPADDRAFLARVRATPGVASPRSPTARTGSRSTTCASGRARSRPPTRRSATT